MNTFEQMTERGHERVCFHQDPKTGLRAIIAIHSTVLGNGLGGTRRWHYATEADGLYDVLRLSEGMTYKAACAELAIGGAKSVILLPKPNHAMNEAEARAMGRFVDTFGGTYIAAEDVGVTIQYVDWMALETHHVMGGEKVSRGGDPSPFTAEGVINGMKAAIAHLGKPVDFAGITVAIQGLGAVGYKIARMLKKQGAEIIAAEIREDVLKQAVDELGVTPVDGDTELFTTDCDILAPCALGGVIDANLVRKLRCKVICGGANNVLDDPDEDAAALKNAGILYTPDFVVNAGGLIHLAGLYLNMTEEELDRKNADIEGTTATILRDAESMASTHAAAVAYGRRRIEEGAKEKVHAG
jgi:leucine dehydrogenase